MAAPFFPSLTFLYDSHCNLFRGTGGRRAIGRRSWALFDWQRESGQLPPRTPSHKSSAMERAHFLKRYRCLQGTKSPLWGILFGEEGLGGLRTVCQGQPHCLPLWKVGAKSRERLCSLATLCTLLTPAALPGGPPPRLLSVRPTHTSVIQLKHTTQAPDLFRTRTERTRTEESSIGLLSFTLKWGKQAFLSWKTG